MNSDAPNPIDRVHHTAAYELVVDQLRRVIYLGRFLPGEKLPPERELAQQLGVSRTTVREAVRLLEGEKLLAIKRGATGGIVVTAPHERLQNEGKRISAEHRRELETIFEYRFAVECYGVRLAAERRSDEDIARLRELMERMEELAAGMYEDRASVAEYNAADTRFHLDLAAASRNPVFERAVEEIRAGMFLPVGSIFERLTERVDYHHRPILEAVAARDADAAEENMRAHIRIAYEGLQSFFPGR